MPFESWDQPQLEVLPLPVVEEIDVPAETNLSLGNPAASHIPNDPTNQSGKADAP
jgi:hypothetical protein